jgi:hypothetical protein
VQDRRSDPWHTAHCAYKHRKTSMPGCSLQMRCDTNLRGGACVTNSDTFLDQRAADFTGSTRSLHVGVAEKADLCFDGGEAVLGIGTAECAGISAWRLAVSARDHTDLIYKNKKHRIVKCVYSRCFKTKTHTVPW